MIDFGLGKLWSTLIIVAVVSGGVGLAYWQITEGAFKRGEASMKAEANAALDRMEARLLKALKKNETLSDPELDCELKRLRNPRAEC